MESLEIFLGLKNIYNSNRQTKEETDIRNIRPTFSPYILTNQKKKSMSKFVHLHNHSHYSLLDGLTKIGPLVDATKKYNMPAVALTDHGNMHGAIEFFKTAKKAEVKPILGFEAYVANRSRHQKEAHVDVKPYHLLLLAKNLEGYKNLLKLTSLAHLEGFYYKPRVDLEILEKYSKGIIASTACLGGEIPRLLVADRIEKAKEVAKKYQDIFGKENFFLEIQNHPSIEHQELANKRILELSKNLDIPVIATQDSHYLNKEDAAAQDALIAIQTNTLVNETNRLSMKDEDFSFKTTEEMIRDFSYAPQAIENTLKIAEMCNAELEIANWVFPIFELPKGETDKSYLKKLTFEGLKTRGSHFNEERKKDNFERIAYESKIINDKGYAAYFLIVADFVNEAKKRGVVTNTRGSAAGSLVSYLIGISDVDPLEYMLPFERFLNPYRPSLPDIDLDFADDRRDELIEYAKQRYGHDKVAQIGTFGTMMARAAVRDITRVLGHEYSTGDKIAKMIPLGAQGNPMTIQKAKDQVPELKDLYENKKEAKEIMDFAQKIEGSARHVSVHAAGVVISPGPLTDFLPLQSESRGDSVITQFDMHATEDAGLVKLDFLGIRNLSILGRAVELVERLRDIKVDLLNIPIDDKKSFELLARGETIGLFQLNGAGMTRYLKELKPTVITDIFAMISLFRPGPMDNIPHYINRKHGREPISYPDPRLEKILEKTYGVITYQEDVMLLAIELAGYTWATVDKFRKAIGKKQPELMAKLGKTFVEDCQKHGGLTKQKAEDLWSLLDPFKGYSFNKAHAASYGMISYQTAYMKANYPGEFMTAVLTAESGDMDKMAEIIAECNRMNIKILPPDINESFTDFSLVNPAKLEDGASKENHDGERAIRFGLLAVKNVGENVVKNIITERKENGPFASLEDLLERVQSRDLNKKSLESLIKAGAFDKFEERNTLLQNIDNILAYQKESKSQKTSNQSSLFGGLENSIELPTIQLEKTSPMKPEERLKHEKELLGLYISGHPMDKYREKMAQTKLNISAIKKFKNQTPVTFMAMVESVKNILTKKGDPMAFMKVADLSGDMEMVVFPRVLNDFGDLLVEDKCVIIKGKVSTRNDEASIICEQVLELKD